MSERFEAFVQKLDQEGLAATTISNYRATWNTFKKWILRSDPSLQDAALATQKDIADFKRYISKHGGRGGDPATQGTTNKYFVQLNAIFRYFSDQGFIPDNPVGPIKKPPAARRTPKWLTRNEQNTFIREIRRNSSLKDYAIIMLMLQAGLRVHEVCNLEKNDLRITARKGIAYIRGKGYKDREVPLNTDVRLALEHHLKSNRSDSPYVFTSQRSNKMSVRAVQHMVEKYRDRVKIKHLSCHSLRHSFGHDLLSASPPVPIDRVATLMGHFKEDGSPNIEMTMIYTTPSLEDLEEAVERISWT